MTNETTASQPKSIGDDAQFQKRLAEYDAAIYPGQKALRLVSLIALIDRRAPAAQAFATIQAAPDDLPSTMEDARKLIQYLRIENDSKVMELYDLKKKLAATIHEPVMVAEPVRDIRVLRRWATQIDRMASTFIDERSLLCQQAAILLYRIAYLPDAAPMVADPAGVAVKSDCCPACGGSGHSMMLAGGGPDAEEHLADCVYCKGTGGLLDAYNGTRDLLAKSQQENVELVCRLAATVKAVPSEALELAGMVVKATFGDHKILVPRVDLSGKGIGTLVYFAAPLADKTGGGE